MSKLWNELGDVLKELREKARTSTVDALFDNAVKIFILIIKDSVSSNQLKKIDGNIKSLIKKHLKDGLRYFEEVPGVKDQRLRSTLINDARRAFTEAAAVEAPLQAAKAIRLVGVCYDLLGEEENARLRYEESFNKTHQYYEDLLRGFETTASNGLFDVLLGISAAGQPIMYADWASRYLNRKKLEQYANETNQYLYETRNFINNRGVKIPAVWKDIKPIPTYKWADV